MKIKSYKDLIVYQKSYKLVLDTYRVTQKFPKQEMYGLSNQMRRAAISIPSNIAEGYRRGSRKEYTQFLRVALGSCSELETQISLSNDLEFLSGNDINTLLNLVNDVGRLLTKLIMFLK